MNIDQILKPSIICTVCATETERPYHNRDRIDEKVSFCSAECFGVYKKIKDTFFATKARINITEINVEKILLFICLTTITIIFITTTNQCGMKCMAYNHDIHTGVKN